MKKQTNKQTIDYWLDQKTMQFVGDFEGMYQNIDDPWGCREVASSFNNNILLDLIADIASKKGISVHDLGCGLGHFAIRIKDRLESFPIEDFKVSGSDVASSAISKAKGVKGIDFYVCDIQSDVLKQQYDVIVMSEVLWYLLENLEFSFENIYNSLSHGGTLIVKQYFPEKQNYGRDIIDGVDGFNAFMRSPPFWKKDLEIKINTSMSDGIVFFSTFLRN